MKKPDDIWGIPPQEIREIRCSLNLTRAEAGEMLGGGPSAFAKYEKRFCQTFCGIGENAEIPAEKTGRTYGDKWTGKSGD